jgi:hypothetical protein
MRVRPAIVDVVNASAAEQIAEQGEDVVWRTLHAWEQDWEGLCGKHACEFPHDFDVTVAIVDTGDIEPLCLLSVGDDAIGGVDVPLTKARIRELIADLESALEEL